MRTLMFIILFLAFSGCISTEESAAGPEEIIEHNRTIENISEVEENISEDASPVNTTVNETINESETEYMEENGSVEEPEDTDKETFNEEERIPFGGGNYLLVIDDVVWYGDESCAAVSIWNTEDILLKKDVICPGSDYYWVSPERRKFRIVVTEVAAGYSGESWAKVIIYG